MSAIEQMSTQPVAQAIGWALLQFVWQGALVGIITGAALVMLRRSAADIRYVVATIGLSLMLTMPVVSAVQSWRAFEEEAVAVAAIRPPASLGDGVGDPDGSEPGSPGASIPLATPADHNTPARMPSAWLPMLLSAWMCGVLVLTLRLATGWLWVRRLRTHGTAPAAAAIQELAARLTRRLHVSRTVRFLESTLVEVPTVIGWLKPVVLMPASALASLTPQQLEAIIAHELAHIRRHDYLVNLLQTLVETLLFYHPAVWWLSRRIRIERENCCDDLAVNLCGDAVTYARALADLEELRGESRIVLAASGGSLRQRVRRLLGSQTHAGRGPGWLAGGVAVLLMAGITAGTLGEAGSGPRLAPEQTVAVERHAAQVAKAAGQAVTAASPAPAQAGRADAADARGRASKLPEIALQAQQAATAEPAEPTNAAVAMAAARQPAAADAQIRAASLAEAAASVLPAIANAFSGRLSAVAAQSGNFVWSDGKQKLQVNYSGTVEFTDDDTDVKSLSPGGWLRIREEGSSSSRTVEFRADDAGRVQRRYWSGASEQAFEPEGRQWLAQALPRFIRQTGLGAPARVARILAAKGVDGVVAEIALIEGSWAKRVYFRELLKTRTIDDRAIEQILARAGRELTSDFELASLLIESAERALASDAALRAYVDAARSIRSDFEMRRVYSSALKRGPVSSEVLAGVLDASASIESDFEAASLLIQIAKLQPLDARSRPAFFKTAAGIGSDFERRRTLNALLSRVDLDADTLGAVLGSAAEIGSDFEQGTLLLAVLEHHSIEGANRAPFFRVVDGLGSSFERSRVLQAVAKRSDASPETVVGVLRAAQGMTSSFESAQVLLAIAERHRLSAEARSLFIDVAERLGDFEQGRVLSALVKSERVGR